MGTNLSKTTQALFLYREGRFKEAFAIFKTFKLTFNREQLRLIEIAHESLSGHAPFYEAIGISTFEIINNTHELIKKTYIL